MELWILPNASTSSPFSSPSFPKNANSNSNNNSSSSSDAVLQRLSDARAAELAPVFAVFALVFLLGVPGNALTVYIYLTKFKATWSRTAIVALGTFDLMSCLLAVPGEVADLRFSFNYRSDVMCRLSRAAATFPSIASGIMLMTVAVDRWRLICRPLRSGSSRSRAGRHVIAVCVTSLLLTWPAALVYGVRTVEVGAATGTECSTSEDLVHSVLPLAYNLVLSLVFLSSFTAITVCYVLIARQLHRQGEFRKTFTHMRDRKRRLTQSELEASQVSDAGRDLSHTEPPDHYTNTASARAKKTSLTPAAAATAEAATTSNNDIADGSSQVETIRNGTGCNSNNNNSNRRCSNNNSNSNSHGDRNSAGCNSGGDNDNACNRSNNSNGSLTTTTTTITNNNNNYSNDSNDIKSNPSSPSSPGQAPSFPPHPLPPSTTPSSPPPPPAPRNKVTRTPSLMSRLRVRGGGVSRGSVDSSAAHAQNARTRRTTAMLCLISVVFVLSFVPHLAVKLVKLTGGGGGGGALSGLILYNLCARSYFLNSCLNVFIYGFCSLRFRRECVKVGRKVACCVGSRSRS